MCPVFYTKKYFGYTIVYKVTLKEMTCLSSLLTVEGNIIIILFLCRSRKLRGGRERTITKCDSFRVYLPCALALNADINGRMALTFARFKQSL